MMCIDGGESAHHRNRQSRRPSKRTVPERWVWSIKESSTGLPNPNGVQLFRSPASSSSGALNIQKQNASWFGRDKRSKTFDPKFFESENRLENKQMTAFHDDCSWPERKGNRIIYALQLKKCYYKTEICQVKHLSFGFEYFDFDSKLLIQKFFLDRNSRKA